MINMGSSKANRLRTLWEIEVDSITGKIIEEMLLYYEAKKSINDMGSAPLIKSYLKNV